MKKPNPPRKHHFVQAEHLRQFKDESGLLHVYSKNGSQFTGTPEGIFKKKDLNSFEGPSGLDTSFEGLVTDVENNCWPTLQNILKRGSLLEADIDVIATYLALSKVRNPTMQAGIIEQHRQIVTETAKIMERSGKYDELGPNPIDPSKGISELLSDGVLKITVNNSVYIDAIKHVMMPFANILKIGFCWGLVKSTRKRVIVSDHPLTIIHPGTDYGPYGIPAGGVGCEVAFPLSKDCYLLGLWKKPVGVHVNEDVVDELNRRQSMFANRHIAAAYNHKSWLRLAFKFRNFGYYTDCQSLPFDDESYQVMRSGIFRLDYSKKFSGRHPTTKTVPVFNLL